MNTDTYIADGDYIRDIEINDLRNRYTLTKGSTQKMVIAPVVSADPSRHCFANRRMPQLYTSLSPPFHSACGCDLKAYPKANNSIASHLPSVASADLGCVTFRLKMRLAPVRLHSI